MATTKEKLRKYVYFAIHANSPHTGYHYKIGQTDKPNIRQYAMNGGYILIYAKQSDTFNELLLCRHFTEYSCKPMDTHTSNRFYEWFNFDSSTFKDIYMMFKRQQLYGRESIAT